MFRTLVSRHHFKQTLSTGHASIRRISLETLSDKGIEVSKSLVPVPTKSYNSHEQYTIKDTLFLVDTWRWASLLAKVPLDSSTLPHPTLTPAQAAALSSCVTQLAAHRLYHWHSTLPTIPRLHQDLHLLHTVASELQRLQGTRVPPEGPTSEVHLLGEAVREGLATAKAETGQEVSEWRGEAREEVGKLEVEQHRLEGRLAASMSRFRSEAENVKVRSMYSFASIILHQLFTMSSYCIIVVIVSILLIAVAQKTTNGNGRKGSKDSAEPTNATLTFEDLGPL